MAELTEEGKEPDILFWVGSAGAFDDRAKKITRAFVKILNKANVNFGVLGKEESSSGDAAKRAIDLGGDSIVVSNHGARQLDSVAPTIRALPEIVEAVNGEIDVLLDGGIRRGGDVVKALCLGAKAVLIGRAYAYGLAAAGGPGVARAIEIIKTDVLRTMKLLGCPSVKDLNGSYVTIPDSWK